MAAITLYFNKNGESKEQNYRFNKDGCSITTWVKSANANWLTYQDYGNKIKLTASSNSSGQREATIKPVIDSTTCDTKSITCIQYGN